MTMRRVKRTFVRPSPALVVASLALLVALGGTSFAAVNALVPRNSVGSEQVIDHSLLTSDFKVPPTGPAGPPGPSAAFSKYSDGPLVPSGSQAILDIPQAGNYVIFAKAFFTASDIYTDPLIMTCALVAGNDNDLSQAEVHAGHPSTLSLNVVHQFGGADIAYVKCSSDKEVPYIHYVKITAIKVGTLTNSAQALSK